MVIDQGKIAHDFMEKAFGGGAMQKEIIVEVAHDPKGIGRMVGVGRRNRGDPAELVQNCEFAIVAKGKRGEDFRDE